MGFWRLWVCPLGNIYCWSRCIQEEVGFRDVGSGLLGFRVGFRVEGVACCARFKRHPTPRFRAVGFEAGVRFGSFIEN